MAFFVWNESFEGGVTEIDAQHRKLVDLINGLHEAMLVGQGAGMLERLLGELIEYTIYHFECEEKIFIRYNCPGLEGHLHEHRMLTEQVLEYQRRFEENHFKNAVKIAKFMKAWLRDHILDKDCAAMRHIKNQ